MRSLVIGGTSGIGEQLVASLWHDVDNEDDVVVAPAQHDLDVTSHEKVWSFFSRNEKFDEVVYCAGVQQIESLGYLSRKAWEIIDVNYTGFIRVMNVLAHDQGDYPTSVVAVVSDASRVAMRNSIAYCSSKAALAHAVRCAAREMAPTWRVNGVSPAVVANTPMTDQIDRDVPRLRGWTPEQARQYEESMIPMGRRATKTEVVSAIKYALRGPEFMTGSIIEITGGK